MRKVQGLPGVFGAGMLLLWVALLTACSSTPKVDWNSRVGSYTYDQAVLDMGPPVRSSTLADGTKVADWFQRRSARMNMGVGTGFYGGGGGIAMGHEVSPGSSEVYLRLMFDPQGKLLKWEQVRQ